MRPSAAPRSTTEQAADGTVIRRPDEADEFMTDENVFILESWHSPLDPALSIARGRLAPGATSVPHILPGTAERYIIVEGEGELALAGLGVRPVRAGDVVFFPAGRPQTVTNTGETDLVLYAICTPPFDAANYVELGAGAEPTDGGDPPTCSG
jgi:mannose-6-phosphate isomerase-like protein (cupin superfamily)